MACQRAQCTSSISSGKTRMPYEHRSHPQQASMRHYLLDHDSPFSQLGANLMCSFRVRQSDIRAQLETTPQKITFVFNLTPPIVHVMLPLTP
jgi:hypothetical protein